MNLPTQAAPVVRGHARAYQGAMLTQQGCNIWKCGGHIAACAGACIPNPLNPACAACLGSAYDSCKDCF
jgi:hypothetical protein